MINIRMGAWMDVLDAVIGDEVDTGGLHLHPGKRTGWNHKELGVNPKIGGFYPQNGW